MNWKRLWLTALVVFIVAWITNILIHGPILGGFYGRPDVVAAFRTEAQMNQYMWVMIITGAIFSFFFAYIFAKGYEGKGMAEGIRYGIIIGLFYCYVTSFDQFVIYPIPYGLAWLWVITGLIQSIILGIVAALIYKPRQATAVATAG